MSSYVVRRDEHNAITRCERRDGLTPRCGVRSDSRNADNNRPTKTCGPKYRHQSSEGARRDGPAVSRARPDGFAAGGSQYTPRSRRDRHSANDSVRLVGRSCQPVSAGLGQLEPASKIAGAFLRARKSLAAKFKIPRGLSGNSSPQNPICCQPRDVRG